MDGAGDVYFSDQIEGTVKELVAVGGTLPASPAVRTAASGFVIPSGVAVDGSGNIYVGDSSLVYEILAVGGTIPATPTVRRLVTQTQTNPTGLAIDQLGNVFFVDSYDTPGSLFPSVNEILAVNGVIPAAPTIRTLSPGFNDPYGIAVDASGNVYVADNGTATITEILAVGGGIPASPATRTFREWLCGSYRNRRR